MPHQHKTTIDPEVIKAWVEERGGRPARIKSADGEEAEEILKIDFGQPEKNLEEISWDEFFKAFEENNLAFVYQEEKADGETSTFFELTDRNAAPTIDGGTASTAYAEDEDEEDNIEP